MSTLELIEKLKRAAGDVTVVPRWDTALLMGEAIDRIRELEADVVAADALLDQFYRAEEDGPLPTHPPLVTPVDPRSDCSLTHWVVRL